MTTIFLDSAQSFLSRFRPASRVSRSASGVVLERDQHGRLWLPTLAKTGGIGIELGVARGYYSNAILNNSRLQRLYSIDAWGDHHDTQEYFACLETLSQHGSRSVALRMLFNEALSLFPDDYFDFVYIDAYAGEGQQGGQLLYDWWPKAKEGAVFGGHDYHEKWQPTIEAVDRFCEDTGCTLHIVPGAETRHPHDRYDSWYVIK